MLISLDHWGREVICYPLQTTAQSAKAAKSPHSPSRWPTSRTAGVRSAPRPAPAWPHHHRPRFITTTTAAVCYADRGTRYRTHQSRNASSVSSVPLATTLLCRLPRCHNHSARRVKLASKARLQCTQNLKTSSDCTSVARLLLCQVPARTEHLATSAQERLWYGSLQARTQLTSSTIKSASSSIKE